MREYLAQACGVNRRRNQTPKIAGEDLPGCDCFAVRGRTHIHHEHDSKYENDEKPLHFSLAGVQLKFLCYRQWPWSNHSDEWCGW